MGSRGRPRHGQQAGETSTAGSADQPGPRPAGGRAERRKALRRIRRRQRRSAVREIPVLIGVALLIALLLKTFLVQAFVIPTGSMEQTIRIGDRVLVDKLTPWFGAEPERGDVVVFKDPGGWLQDEEKPKNDDIVGVKQAKQFLTFIGLLPSADEQDLIKRVVGVGGDTVRCCDESGRITVNGTPLQEPYLHPGNNPSEIEFEVKVPENRLFVMGDHRADSADSRYHLDEEGQGTISEDLVVGRAVVIAWPFGHWRRLEAPETYASVEDAPTSEPRDDGPAHRLSPMDQQGLIQLPTPAELPLVMGVVGLRRSWRGRLSGVRSGCGGFGGRRAFRSRRIRGPAQGDGRDAGPGVRARAVPGRAGRPGPGAGGRDPVGACGRDRCPGTRWRGIRWRGPRPGVRGRGPAPRARWRGLRAGRPGRHR
ncbi:signal peptidase I [Streptomyces pactum]|uniref:Signal peptidase I n=1 Tax=Streptomyces pactum TaxID=68249 RepID=A0ABS0NPU2_9ACTN|nr:signal peptidase I [Streptomyces pactum]